MTQTREDALAAQGEAQASLSVTLGQLFGRMGEQQNSLDRVARLLERQEKRSRSIKAIPTPPVQFPVVSGAIVQPGAAVLLGPEDGQVWDIRRVTVSGLAAAAAPAFASATVTNPGAGATIATTGNIPPGLYTVNVLLSLQGTIAAGDANNMRLRFNATNQAAYAFPATAGQYPMPSQVVQVTASNPILVTTVGAASGASAVYGAVITVTPLASSVGDTVNLYREIVTATPGQPQNFIKDFSPPFTSPGPTWAPGGGLMLHSPDQLLLTGTNLATTAVTLILEGNVMDAYTEAPYLL